MGCRRDLRLRLEFVSLAEWGSQSWLPPPFQAASAAYLSSRSVSVTGSCKRNETFDSTSSSAALPRVSNT